MDKLEDVAALGRNSEENFRLVQMMQLLLQAGGTLWPQMQRDIVTFLITTFHKLSKLRWGATEILCKEILEEIIFSRNIFFRFFLYLKPTKL